MYVLNLNLYFKVADSRSPLSGNAVKVSFQIKKGLFDLPNIVFSPFRGWKWLVLSLIGLPSLSSLTHTHTHTHTHTQTIKYYNHVCLYYMCYGVVRVPCKGAKSKGCKQKRIETTLRLIKKLLTHQMQRQTWTHHESFQT